MTGFTGIQKAREDIAKFWKSDELLAESRGCVFNIAYVGGKGIDATGPVDAIILGMNPSEDPTREDGLRPSSETNWVRLCQQFADAAGGRWAATELFFWSSHDHGALKTRIPDLTTYLDFCAVQNRVMFDFHRPSVIIQPGIGWGDEAVDRYHLRSLATFKLARRPQERLLVHYEMPDGTPWLSTAHWTASHGFSDADKSFIRGYAAAVAAQRRRANSAGPSGPILV